MTNSSKHRPWSSCLTQQQLKIRNKEDDQIISNQQQEMKKSLPISEKNIPLATTLGASS